MKPKRGHRFLDIPGHTNAAVLLAMFLLFLGHTQLRSPTSPDHRSRLHVLEQQTDILSGVSLRLERNPNQDSCQASIFSDPPAVLKRAATPTAFVQDASAFEPLVSHFIYSQVTSTFL